MNDDRRRDALQPRRSASPDTHRQLLDREEIARRVMAIRASLGVPAEAAAGFAGKGRRWLYYLEAGRVDPDTEAINGLALGFGVSVGVLLGLEPLPARFDLVKRREFLGALGASAGLALLGARGDAASSGPAATVKAALDRSVAAAWARCQACTPADTRAEAQAHLFLLEQLFPQSQPALHSACHRLLGAALHRQGRYHDAFAEHERAYRAGAAGGDVWSMVGSRSWQADGYKALGHHAKSLEYLESALHLVSRSGRPEHAYLKAHLLASAAQDAARLQDAAKAGSYLYASASLIEQVPASPDFDHTGWLESAGICALYFGQHELAIKRLEEALTDDAPVPHKVIRRVALAQAYVRKRDREAALAQVRAVLPYLRVAQSRELNGYMRSFVRRDLAAAFRTDPACLQFAAEAAGVIEGV